VANWRGRPRIGAGEALAIRKRVASGEPIAAVAVAFDRSYRSVQRVISRSGGLTPRRSVRSSRRLSTAEREEISRALLAGRSLRSIAGDLGRSPSTVAREVAGNGGRHR
jgi:DNA-binding NarL/FixJ family response regulator